MNFKISGFSDEINENIDIQFSTLNKLGIEYFEPRGINGKNVSELSYEEKTELLEKMREYNIKASSIGSPVGKIDIDGDFGAHLELLRAVIDTAHAIHCDKIRIFSFYLPEESRKVRREDVLEKMRTMVELAKSENVVLLHENEKGIYGEHPEECLDIFKSVPSKHLRGVFDPANFVQCGVKDVSSAFDMLCDHVDYMHIKDALDDGSIVPAGMGRGCIEDILKKLKARGYNGFLSLEPHLGSFKGLEALEQSGEMLKLEKASDKTFALAYNSLKKIIERI